MTDQKQATRVVIIRRGEIVPPEALAVCKHPEHLTSSRKCRLDANGQLVVRAAELRFGIPT